MKSYAFSTRCDEDLHRFYLEQRSFFWTEREVDFSTDINDWENLTDEERHFYKYIFIFFLHSDGLICENISTRFQNDIKKIKGAEYFYNIQVVIENIHEILYDKIINLFITDQKEIQSINDRIDIDPVINEKIAWIEQWMNSDESFGARLVAFAVAEGLFFAGSFAAIFYLKHLGKMHGLVQGNELISRDEYLHRDYNCYLYRYKIDREDMITNARVIEIIEDAVAIEKKFYNVSLDVGIIGLNSNDMNNYIKYMADGIFERLGYKKHYNAKNPFSFMENIDLGRRTNFFERKATEYLKVERSELTFDDIE